MAAGKAEPEEKTVFAKGSAMAEVPILNWGASVRLRRPDRAIRLYLFCLWQKRIPLLSLARLQTGAFPRGIRRHFLALFTNFQCVGYDNILV
jgi:hypothetical protein